jgi:hypothetical protein
MIYSVVFITNQQLRDIKLEQILNPDFNSDKYIHEGEFDFILRVRNRRWSEVWSPNSYKNKYLTSASKWKTVRGAENALRNVKVSDLKFSTRGESEKWNKNKSEYVPVVCDISIKWNEFIKQLIKEEESDHQKKINSLNKKITSVK